MRVSLKAAVLGSAISIAVSVASTYYYCQSNKPESKNHSVKKPKQHYDQSIIDEQQARTKAFLKDEGMAKVRGSTVVVVGAGGVGSWVATMLVRSGVGKIRVIDFDQVSLSSLNRHAVATLADVGTPKVNCMAARLREVCPWVEIEPVNSIWNKDVGPPLLENADFVVDCIDNIDTKVDLLEYCVKNNLPVISSMGAGAKGDPTRIMVGDISTTYEDPLSRSVRIKLRYKGVTGGIPVVYSTEKPGKDKAQLLNVSDSELEQGGIEELSVLKDFRVRILPVLGPLPALFGLTIATHLLNTIGGYTSVFDPIKGGYSLAGKKRIPLYESMLNSIQGQVSRIKKQDNASIANLDEVEYLLEEVWRGRSISGEYSRIKLTIWDPSKPFNIHNMVPVSKKEQEIHEREVIKGGKQPSEIYDKDILEEVESRMKLDKWYQNFRVN